MTQTLTPQIAEQLDRLAISELILRERTARDFARWSEMASYYHPESLVEVSWFKGSGAEFVDRTRQQYERTRQKPDQADRLNFHELGAAVVTLNGDRALADMHCTLHGFSPFDGVQCTMTGFTRLWWRAQRLDGRWLLAGLRCVYLRDMLTPVDPSQAPKLDEAELASYRPSYRFVCYNLVRQGITPQQDLPGIDQPEGVAELLRKEEEWLRQG